MPKTWMDLDAVPDGYVGEIVGGEIRLQPSPDPPHVNAIEVFRLSGEHWLLGASAGGAQKVRAEPFDAIELDLSVLWTDGTDPATDNE